ncbi:TetR/AcrR family transcriptional regulator [Companilactobacillus halodurans]|uniref:TetR/AcrR family transcriptional regulator n=1 Tax=Companilactobacillus halodurans TaxID=2584183 RepID=A0A5P0ZMF8_9LACO|nr:TetR/AcrR family transcriptional regulator [Companilactobacillus halodurans]MQS75366.1 TetR/AcrR family transcriptional regulator [Companilactobacillus halodurans]MQS97310.1 TetR/AcrR family transcriptional regulator [Companilactobacillus halodurans]
MVGIKNNRRTKYTKEIIQKTVLDQLQEKPIDAITVTDICKKADINRTTFYRYYDDIYDCVDTIEDKFVDTIELPKDSTPFKSLEKLLEAFYKNHQISNLVFVEGRTRLLEKMHQVMSPGDKEMSNFDEYQGTYIMLGMQGIMKRWVKNGMKETPYQLTKIIEKVLFADELRAARDNLKEKQSQ